VDHDAWFTGLYQAHYDAVFRYAARRADPEIARDIAAEAFLVVWRRPSAVPADPAAVEPWLYGVARRVLANSERSHRRSRQLAGRLLGESRPAYHAADIATAVTERVRVEQALRRLPERDQEVLRLIGWEELDLSQAAAAMGCSRSAMAVRLHRARRRMARALQVIDQGNDGPVSPVGSETVIVEEKR
jgi:RNA polymerase sigma-70 factor (ECF subfamily)